MKNLLPLLDEKLFQDKKMASEFEKIKNLLEELEQKELPEQVISNISAEIEKINSLTGTEKEQFSKLKKVQLQILQIVQKEMQLVTKHFYQNIWMPVGMAAFGLPLGAAIGALLDRPAFLSLGLPFGLVIGVFVGKIKDEKALKEGRVLKFEK